MDRVVLVVKYRPGAQVGLRHPERRLDLEQGVVGADDLVPGNCDLRDVGDVTLQAGQFAGSFNEGPVDAATAAGQLHEPVLLQRPPAVGDLLGPLDLLVQGVVVAPVTFRGVVIDHPPLPRIAPGAHDPFGLHRLPVMKHPAVLVEVLREVVGDLANPGADDEREPCVFQGVQIRGRQHPRISDHDHVLDVMSVGLMSVVLTLVRQF